MNCKVYPPKGFSASDCYRHIKQLVRTRTKTSLARKMRDGGIVISGSGSDIAMMKIVLSRYNYRLGV